MPNTTLGLVLFIAASLISLLVWWIMRRASPAPQQRADDRKREIAAYFTELQRLESAGDLAGADALRRRMRDSFAAADCKCEPGGDGQRLPPPPPAGHDDHPPR